MEDQITMFQQLDDFHAERLLQAGVQSDSRGRAILTILYLVVLGLCFVVPIFYYFRMHMEDRRLRRLRDMQLQSVIAGLQDSSPEVREEMRAARRKYREEKRARILQLFEPVHLIITKAHLKDKASENINQESWDPLSGPNNQTGDLEQGADARSVESAWEDDITGDDPADNLKVELPLPGLLIGMSKNSGQQSSSLYDIKPSQCRLVPNLCAICLSNYEFGESIVWSSNPACEHAFHEPCMERWLLKQRGRPLCPCCRRDFVVDPLDEEETEEAGIQSLLLDQGANDDFLLDVF